MVAKSIVLFYFSKLQNDFEILAETLHNQNWEVTKFISDSSEEIDFLSIWDELITRETQPISVAVFDLSFPSIEFGFLINKSLDHGIQVVCIAEDQDQIDHTLDNLAKTEEVVILRDAKKLLTYLD